MLSVADSVAVITSVVVGGDAGVIAFGLRASPADMGSLATDSRVQ